MSEKNHNPYIQELGWDEARKYIIKVNPKFVEAVDAVSPDKSHTVFKVRYFYGNEILKRAVFRLPNADGRLVPIHDSSISTHVRDALDYNLKTNPVMMLLNNSLELFLPLEDRTIPMSDLVFPGSIFGTYRLLTTEKISHHPAFIWDLTAGARSIFMLAKISDAEKYKKLRKEFSLCVEKPSTFINHWKVFREIANHKKFQIPWHIDILAFPRVWFEHLNEDAWMPFNFHLLKAAWHKSEFWRNLFFWDTIFSVTQRDLQFKPSAYIADTVKYLLAISVGESPGFIPATNDIGAPIKELQRIYTDIYNLKQAPIIMHPGALKVNRNQSHVYYSLRYPSNTEFGVKSRTRDNFTNDLFEIKSLINQYSDIILSNKFKLNNTPFSVYLKNINYEYIHDSVNLYEIKKSKDILSNDPNFTSSIYCKNKPFPTNSSFFKGCIKISYNKK